MPEFDKRDTVAHLHVGGSDIGVQVLLTAVEADAIYGGGAAEGWYTIGTLDGGTFAYEVESEKDLDEAGQQTGKVIETSAQWHVANRVKESSDAVLKLLLTTLQSPHRFRYPLPAGDDGAGNKLHQLWGLYNGLATPGFDFPTAAGEKRLVTLDLTGTKTDTTPAFEFATVDLADEPNWPAALDAFKDAAAP